MLALSVIFFWRIRAYRNRLPGVSAIIHKLPRVSRCVVSAEAALIATMFVAITLTADVRAAQSLQAIPEMLARAHSVESIETGDAVHINDQRLEFQSLYGRIYPTGGVERSYRQLFRGIPIWGEPVVTVVDPDTGGLSVRGHIIADIADDIDTSAPLLDAEEIEGLVRTALTLYSDNKYELLRAEGADILAISAATRASSMPSMNNIAAQQALRAAHPARLWVFLDKHSKARLVYELCLLFDKSASGVADENTALRAFVDARSGQVLKLWRDTLENVLSDKHTVLSEPQTR